MKSGARAKRWKEGGGGGERRERSLLSPPPTPPFNLFALAPFFARPECEKLIRAANFVRFARERLLRWLQKDKNAVYCFQISLFVPEIFKFLKYAN